MYIFLFYAKIWTGQGHNYSFFVGIHDLKRLYTKYEHCNTYHLSKMNLNAKFDARVNAVEPIWWVFDNN